MTPQKSRNMSSFTAPAGCGRRSWTTSRAQGIEGMEIWRTGDRMVMIATVADDYPRARTFPPNMKNGKD